MLMKPTGFFILMKIENLSIIAENNLITYFIEYVMENMIHLLKNIWEIYSNMKNLYIT